jgi:hypothetical protein
MARKTYDDIKTHCIVCAAEVPTDRLKYGAITCSKEHQKLRHAQLQAITDKKDCRYCRRPSTPEEREAYKRFRTMERKRPDLIYPEAFEQWKLDWKASGGDPTPEAFAEYRQR